MQGPISRPLSLGTCVNYMRSSDFLSLTVESSLNAYNSNLIRNAFKELMLFARI